MKITIIGPVYPYKGGISHYTGLMAKNLSKTHEVDIVSFKVQYPGLLYKLPQKDYENDSFRFENTKYLINTVNPFSCIKTIKHIKENAPELIIFQWWHPFFAFIYRFLLKGLTGWRRTKLHKAGQDKSGQHSKIIFLCHNVLPHEGFPMQKLLTKAVLKKADAYIVHSQTDASGLENLIKSPLYIKTVIPAYDAFKTDDISCDDARDMLSIGKSGKIILFFGYIREYKGLKHLIRAMPLITAKHPDILLLIAGDYFENNKDEYTALIESSGCADKIKVYDGYIPDKEVSKFFCACDLVVCPYESATQSAIVQVAYGYRKPVVATNAGGLPEVVTDGVTGYITDPCDEKKLADAVIKYFDLSNEERGALCQNIEKEAYKFSWDRLNETVEALFEKASES